MKKLIIAIVALGLTGCDPLPRESEVSVRFVNCMNANLARYEEANRAITPEVWEEEREFCLAAAEASTK